MNKVTVLNAWWKGWIFKKRIVIRLDPQSLLASINPENEIDLTIGGQPVTVRRYFLYRDGGTRRFITDQGEIEIPAPRKNLPPTFNGKVLIPADGDEGY